MKESKLEARRAKKELTTCAINEMKTEIDETETDKGRWGGDMSVSDMSDGGDDFPAGIMFNGRKLKNT